MQENICMCSVLTNGSTIIYLVKDDEFWIEPCIVQAHGTNKVSFTPFQIFSITPVMHAINNMHILCTYSPEPEIEESYRSFLNGYLNDISIPVN